MNLEEKIKETKEKEVQEMVDLNHKTTFQALDLMKNENFVKALPIFNGETEDHNEMPNDPMFNGEKEDQNQKPKNPCDELLNPIATGSSFPNDNSFYPSTSTAGNGLEVKKNPVPQLHILTVCQKFVMLFLVSKSPKVMSLEFASKVIHGTDYSKSMQKSKARRLYDVSNVLIEVSQRFPLLQKVTTPLLLNSGRRTAFQYIGPDLDEIALDTTVIAQLPPYRQKHLLFDSGKKFLQLPTLPDKITNLTTVRLKPFEQPWPWPVDRNHGLDMTKATINDLRAPLQTRYLVQLEAKRLGHKIPVNEEFASKKHRRHLDQLNQFLEDASENTVSVAMPTENLQYAILPKESSVLTFLN